MALLDYLTKDNFVDHPPFFPVYDYWYNLLVDKLNTINITESGGYTQLTTDYVYPGDLGVVNIDGVALGDGMVEAYNLRTIETTITATEIVGNTAGDLAHASGVTLYSPASGNVVELVSAVLIYDFNTAAYTGGGNDTVLRIGTTAVTGVVTSANLLGAAGDKIVVMYPLATAGIPLVQAEALNIFSGTAWTQPGTAAGTLKIICTIRTHVTGL